MLDKAIVLLSAGLDSTVNLYQAKNEFEVYKTLTFDYGQRAVEKEISRSQQIAAQLGVDHEVIKLPWLQKITQSSLVNRASEIPSGESVKIDDLKTSQQTAKAVWVPNRNGVFLNIAAAYAESAGAQWVIPGFNKEEATTFPDNSKEFMSALDHSFAFSTANQIKVKCFTLDMNKREIVSRGKDLGVPFELLWSCYFYGEEICGKCESCQRYLRAVGEES